MSEMTKLPEQKGPALRELLLARPATAHGKALFRSVAKIAEALCRTTPYFSEVDKESTRVYISQVFGNSRGPSERLAAGLLHLVKSKLPPGTGSDHFVEELREILGFWKEAVGDDYSALVDMTNEQEFNDLEMEADRATTHFIITHSPAEVTDSPKARLLQLEMLWRLGAIDNADLSDPLYTRHLARLTPGSRRSERNPTAYCFHVHSKQTCLLIWKNLHDFLVKQNVTSPADKLAELDRDSKLSLYYIDPVYCIHPTIVFDPTKPTVRGFVFFYYQNQISIARMSQHAILLWQENLYNALEVGSIERKQVRWSDLHSKPKGKSS